MKALVLGENLVSALNRICINDINLMKAWEKVEKILKDYAEHKRVSYKKLRIIDVSDARGSIQSQFLKYIESTPRLPEQTEKRYRRYVMEKKSIIGRLIATALDVKSDNQLMAPLAKSVLLEQVPDYLKPLLGKLPRLRSEAARDRKTGQNHVESLTANGHLVWLALCRVDSASNISLETSPLECLLTEHYADTLTELRSLASSVAEFQRIKHTHYILLDKLKLRREVPPPMRLQFENWPQPLQDEFSQFLHLATGAGILKPSLRESAKEHKFSLKTYRQGTIRAARVSIAQMLPLIPYSKTLSVFDLIRVQLTEVIAEAGPKMEERNPNIDLIREHERGKDTKASPVGYDTALFRIFTKAVTQIAARTGYGHLIPAFRKAYKIETDLEREQKIKAGKKLGISRDWIDDELERMGIIYDRLVNKGMFKRIKGRSLLEADHAMRLCLFYPQFLIMRLLGYRQEAIRKCITNDNIKFLPDGTVILHFPEGKVKNACILHMEIKPLENGLHERLRKVLIKYHRKVLPYVKRRSGVQLGQEFFVHFYGNTGQFAGFNESSDYSCYFKQMVRKFLNVHQLEPQYRDALNPHFLRGVCADWMVIDLKMSLADAAEVLGDTVQVLQRAYLDQNRPRNATPAFDKVNRARLAEHKSQKSESSDLNRKQVEEYEARLKAKDFVLSDMVNKLGQVQQLTETVLRLQKELEAAKAGVNIF